jgi:hypothetical protein
VDRNVPACAGVAAKVLEVMLVALFGGTLAWASVTVLYRLVQQARA